MKIWMEKNRNKDGKHRSMLNTHVLKLLAVLRNSKVVRGRKHYIEKVLIREDMEENSQVKLVLCSALASLSFLLPGKIYP